MFAESQENRVEYGRIHLEMTDNNLIASPIASESIS